MARSLKTLVQSDRPDAATLRELAAANPTIPPAVMPGGSEIMNLRVASSLIDALDAAAEAEGTTRKVIITRALAQAGFPVPAHDLQDRTPRKRRRAA